ncbi:MAG: Peptidoglycan glycosyltransferase MrdB [Phycisphaerae bacterium]|nr:Peptidoglycan glycosyltransferase MrdB [Phycisphaerae bacterium]
MWRNVPMASWAILAATLLLSVIGVLTVWAAEGQTHVPPHAALRQSGYVAAGLVALVLMARVGYERWGQVCGMLYVVSVLLLVPLVLARLVGGLPLINRINGTYRWIDLPGINLQPAEIMKVVWVLTLAWLLQRATRLKELTGLFLPMMLTALPMGLILLQPDLGTVLLMIPVWFMMAYLAGARSRHLLLLIITGLAIVPFFWFRMEPYQRMRVVGLVLQDEQLRARVIAEPEKYRWLCDEESARQWESGAGFQLLRSKGALGNGGLTGQGWGAGTYVQHNFLTFKHNDFIFSIIGEQWGLLGCVVVIGCYLVILLAGMDLAGRCLDPFGRLVAAGLTAIFVFQALFNIGMTTGLTPAKGMTLPLVSYGGSSMIASYALLGLLISVGRRPKPTLARPVRQIMEMPHVRLG